MNTEIHLDGLVVPVPPGWQDATAELGTADCFSLVRDLEQGGVLQLSLATVEKGPKIRLDPDALLQMLRESGHCRGVGDPVETWCGPSPWGGAAASATFHVLFQGEQELLRMWLLTDGGEHAVRATYVHALDRSGEEIGEVEAMLARLRFEPPAAAA